MKIAIAGYGVEGKANYQYWRALYPDAQFTIVDQRDIDQQELPDGVTVLTGDGVFAQLQGFDLVVRTAGLAPRLLQTDGKVWSATNEFFERCPAPIIGVTGSKGKGTTASLITSILQADGYKVWLVGNIGLASLEVLSQISADDIVVYELSSFQLWDAQRSPQVAVVLYIEQEHLDVHRDMDEYVAAKGNIARYQKSEDRLIFWRDNEYTQRIARLSPAAKVAIPDEAAAHIKEGQFYYGKTLICAVEEMKLRGVHNHTNALAAIDAVWPLLRTRRSIPEGLGRFTGLPHRLQFVASVDGVDYYDDSIATTPSSAIAALRAFEGRSKILILGGSSKGSDFTELASELAQHDVTVLLIGAEAGRIAAALDAAQFDAYEQLQDVTMQEVVVRASHLAQQGGVVLLSPAAASFGMFKNYVDRGEQFIAAVKQLS